MLVSGSGGAFGRDASSPLPSASGHGQKTILTTEFASEALPDCQVPISATDMAVARQAIKIGCAPMHPRDSHDTACAHIHYDVATERGFPARPSPPWTRLSPKWAEEEGAVSDTIYLVVLSALVRPVLCPFGLGPLLVHYNGPPRMIGPLDIAISGHQFLLSCGLVPPSSPLSL